MQIVHSTFLEKFPELGGPVMREPREDGTPARLTLAVGDGTEVWLSHVHVDYPGSRWPCWYLAVYGQDGPGSLWDFRTPPETIVQAFREKAVAAAEGRPEASPWRWDEPSESDITRLADALTARGIVVDYAMSGNRHRAVFGREGYEFPRHLGEGDVLVVRSAGRKLSVFLRSGLGWLAEVRDEARRLVWRVDLASCILGKPSTVPGLPSDEADTDALAESLANVIWGLEDTEPPATALDLGDTGREGSARAMLPPGAPVDAERPYAVVAAQLNAFGFTDVRSSEQGGELVSDTFHIVRWSRARPLGLSDLKKFYADAAVEGRRLMVLSDHGATQPAEEFADKSRTFVFRFDARSTHVFSGSRLAREAGFVR